MELTSNTLGQNHSSAGEQETWRDIRTRLARIVQEVARPTAAVVDQAATFPQQSVSELKKERLLGAAIPVALGGLGRSISELSDMCRTLAEGCASTAMIFAMHQLQLACIDRHRGNSAFWEDFLRRAAAEQWLIASATSEIGVGGDLRHSIAALEPSQDGYRIDKRCSTLSYGEYADAVLFTARQSPASAPSEQVLALAKHGQVRLEKLGVWDTLGMRGTCSPPSRLQAVIPEKQIVPATVHEVVSQTMVPYSHILWSACWLGVAADAVRSTRSYIAGEARKRPGVVPLGSARLVEATSALQCFQALVDDAAREYERLATGRREAFVSPSYRLRINNLKVVASRSVVDICGECLSACGMSGYSNATPFALGRHLRDAFSAALMISNERLAETNASLVLVARGDGPVAS